MRLCKFHKISRCVLKNFNTTYKRYLYEKIGFSEKLIGIIGN